MVVRESLSARLRSQVWQSSEDPALLQEAASADVRVAQPAQLQQQHQSSAAASTRHPCPRHVKPLLHFYKYLQPIPDSGRKLQLNLPTTILCERTDGQEDVLWLRTDPQGFVVNEERAAGVPWRKKLYSELAVAQHQQPPPGDSAASSQHSAEGSDPVVAVRNVAHWRGGADSNKSVVLTRRTFDAVVSAPSELAFSVQQFVRCRGSHASIYRVHWCEKERKCFAVNLVNETKTSDAHGVRLEGATPSEAPDAPAHSASAHNLLATDRSALLLRLAQLSRVYCVSTTSDAKQYQRLPKIRGGPIAESVGAVKRVVDHVQAQLPGIRFAALAADFIKDGDGVWWLIRVVSFDAFYRVLVPPQVMYLPESVIQVHEALRAKYFRQLAAASSGAAAAAAGLGLAGAKSLNTTIPECFLCGSLCAFSPSFSHELAALLRDESESGLLSELTEYRMTLKMVVETIFLLRQRAVVVPTWEAAAMAQRKSLALVAEFTVCFLCYRIYKQQQKLRDVALELHGVFNAVVGGGSAVAELQADASSESFVDGVATSDIFDLALPGRFEAPKSAGAVLAEINAFQSETSPCLNDAPSDERHSLSTYSAVRGADVDPTCAQMRLAFFFHELQDGGPDLVPTDFYLEYQLGQIVSRLHLEGSKCHTPNRWQLCEARVHYLCATFDAFADYCLEKRLLIKMKTVAGDAFHGCTVLSLRPLMAAAKRFGNSLLPESRTDYLVEIRTDAFGLLTLKLTLGLLVDSVAFGHVREVLAVKSFLKEEPVGIYWPPQTFCYTGLAVPRDWIGALMLSEYISVVPMRSRVATHGVRAHLHSHRSAGGGHASAGEAMTKAARCSSVNTARESLLQFQREFGSHSASSDSLALPPSLLDAGGSSDRQVSRRPILSGKPLTIAVTAARRIVFRIAGDVGVFPTFLLGILLRSANFVVPKRDGSAALNATLAWRSAATFPFTRKYSLDRIFSNLKVVSVPALVVLGELVLVLLKSHVIPANVDMRRLETLVEPFWLYQGGSSAHTWAKVLKKAAHVSPEQRTIWNRVIRRCEAAGFLPVFFPSDVRSQLETATSKLTSVGDDLETPASRQPPPPPIDASDLRVKLHALVLCEIFEEMEVLDNGYIEIAEVRSLSKCLPSDLLEHFRVPKLLDPLHVRETLNLDELSSLAEALDSHQHVAFGSVLTSLVQSRVLGEALSEFDRLGCGEINFDEFWSLSESALRESRAFFSSVRDEPRARGFCVRHGKCEVFAIDGVCAECAGEFLALQPKEQQAPVGSTALASPEHATSQSTLEVCSPTESSCSTSATGEETGDAVLPRRRLGVVSREVSGRLIINVGPASPSLDKDARQLVPGGGGGGAPAVCEVGADASPLREADAEEHERQHSIGEGSLNQMLERLEAAEWHVRHRQESLGRASLSELVAQSGRRGSGAPSMRRSSAASSSASTAAAAAAAPSLARSLSRSDTIAELTELVEDAERRKRQSIQRTRSLQRFDVAESSDGVRRHRLLSPSAEPHAQTAKTAAAAKKKQRKKRQKRAAAPVTSSTTALSALLREELRVATRARAAEAKRLASRGLVDRVARAEEKRKQLDRMVLAEIDDVKRRLAKLTSAECS